MDSNSYSHSLPLLIWEFDQMGKKKKEVIQLDRESVIPILKPKLTQELTKLIESKTDQEDFLRFCKKVEYTIRAWYLVSFEEMMQLFNFFEPVVGARKLEELNLSEDEIDELEQKFIFLLFKMIRKSNFKIVTNEENEVATSGQYCLNLPIKVEEAKLDTTLLRRFFAKHPHDNLPYFADQYIIFRRGIGLDRMTAYFIQWKIDAILSRLWQGFSRLTGLRRFFSRKRKVRYAGNQQQLVDEDEDEKYIDEDGDENDLYIERIRIQNMKLSVGNLFNKTTIQEPTFEKIIILYRNSATKHANLYVQPVISEGGSATSSISFGSTVPKNIEDLSSMKSWIERILQSTEDPRAIYVKHFKHIPMADMEIVLPEKKNPGLTALDWVKFLVSAAIGLVTVITQVCKTKADIKVLATVCSAVIGYCAKIYFTFQNNLNSYQNLITRSMYDKQLDSGRGTLLHLCDDVIQQEVKEVIVAFFVLMKYGKFTRRELDEKCELLIKEQFNENCNFDIDDAIHKLEKLGIVYKDEMEQYSSVDVKKANEFIGTTTEEIVTNATQGIP